MPECEGDKYKSSGLCLPGSAQALFVYTGVVNREFGIFDDIFNFIFFNAVVAAFWPVAFILIKCHDAYAHGYNYAFVYTNAMTSSWHARFS